MKKVLIFIAFLCISLNSHSLTFVDGKQVPDISEKEKIQNLEELVGSLMKAGEMGLTVNFETTAKTYGFKSFAEAVQFYAKINDVTVTVEQAKEAFTGIDKTINIEYSKQNLDKLFDIIINSNFRSADRYKKKYLKEDNYKAFFVTMNLEKELARLIKNPNMNGIAAHTWGWWRGAQGESQVINSVLGYCEDEMKKYKIPFQECFVIDLNGKNFLYDFYNKYYVKRKKSSDSLSGEIDDLINSQKDTPSNSNIGLYSENSNNIFMRVFSYNFKKIKVLGEDPIYYSIEYEGYVKGRVKKSELDESASYPFINEWDEKKRIEDEEKKLLSFNNLAGLTTSDLKTLQESLKILGFYNNIVDGIYGDGTLSAFKNWIKSENYESVYKEEYLAEIKSDANQKILNQKKTEEDFSKKEKEKKQNLKDLNFAKQFVNDLIEFQKLNPEALDIINLSKLMLSNKDILNDQWNEIIKRDFEKLKSFVNQNNEFLVFRDNKIKSRKKAELNVIAETNQVLEKNIQFLENYLKNNITSSLVPEILEYVDDLKEIISDQKLSEMNKLIADLGSFYEKNNLKEEYLSFDTNNSFIDQNEVIENIIEIELTEFDFIKNSKEDDYIALVNLSGKAPNALINLEGKVVFENDTAQSCFYQSREIDNKIRLYVLDNISERKFIIKSLDTECNRADLLKYDLLLFKKADLLKENQSYVSALSSEIGNANLKLYKIVSEQKFQEEMIRRQLISEQTKDDIINQTKLGFGALIIDNKSTVLCSDIAENQKGHKNIINLLDNEFQRMAFEKSISKVIFSDLDETFTNIQRNQCGFVYSSETSLGKYLTGMSNTNTNYEVLPIWYSNNQVLEEQQKIEENEKNEMIAIRKAKEEIEKQKELEANRLEAEGVTKETQQIELQAKSLNVVNYFIGNIEKEAEKLFNLDSINETWLSESYPPLQKYISERLKEGWELNEVSAVISDYGLADFRNRRIETFIFDINSRIMNRDIGEYQNNCFRLGIILDAEFERNREPEITECRDGAMDKYKQSINFSSEWLVN